MSDRSDLMEILETDFDVRWRKSRQQGIGAKPYQTKGNLFVTHFSSKLSLVMSWYTTMGSAVRSQIKVGRMEQN